MEWDVKPSPVSSKLHSKQAKRSEERNTEPDEMTRELSSEPRD